MFLTGAADDLDFCIDDLAGFNAEVLAQVREEYKRQQQVRFEAFLSDEGYNDAVRTAPGAIIGRAKPSRDVMEPERASIKLARGEGNQGAARSRRERRDRDVDRFQGRRVVRTTTRATS